MPDADSMRKAFLEDYGEGYKHFGLPRLMGHVVGLLLYEDGPVSLTDMAELLQVSKGPLSQVTGRLRENGLIRKVWVPGSRRDHYIAEDDIFGLAFRNHARLMRTNLDLAQRHAAALQDAPDDTPATFRRRIEEMRRFYELMAKHHAAFLAEWDRQRGDDRIAADA